MYGTPMERGNLGQKACAVGRLMLCGNLLELLLRRAHLILLAIDLDTVRSCHFASALDECHSCAVEVALVKL